MTETLIFLYYFHFIKSIGIPNTFAISGSVSQFSKKNNDLATLIVMENGAGAASVVKNNLRIILNRLRARYF